jgi:hypothetical protein
MDNDIQSYIDSRRKLGESDDIIQAQLLKAGWTMPQVTPYFQNTLINSHNESPSANTGEDKISSNPPSVFKWIISWQLPILLGVFGYHIWFSYSKGHDPFGEYPADFHFTFMIVAMIGITLLATLGGLILSLRTRAQETSHRLIRAGFYIILSSAIVVGLGFATAQPGGEGLFYMSVGTAGLLIVASAILFIVSIIITIVRRRNKVSTPNDSAALLLSAWLLVIMLAAAVMFPLQDCLEDYGHNRYNNGSTFTEKLKQAKSQIALNDIDSAIITCKDVIQGSALNKLDRNDQTVKDCTAIHSVGYILDQYTEKDNVLDLYNQVDPLLQVQVVKKCKEVQASPYTPLVKDPSRLRVIDKCSQLLKTVQSAN